MARVRKGTSNVVKDLIVYEPPAPILEGELLTKQEADNEIYIRFLCRVSSMCSGDPIQWRKGK